MRPTQLTKDVLLDTILSLPKHARRHIDIISALKAQRNIDIAKSQLCKRLSDWGVWAAVEQIDMEQSELAMKRSIVDSEIGDVTVAVVVAQAQLSFKLIHRLETAIQRITFGEIPITTFDELYRLAELTARLRDSTVMAGEKIASLRTRTPAVKAAMPTVENQAGDIVRFAEAAAKIGETRKQR